MNRRIVPVSDDSALQDNNGTDRNFSVLPGVPGKLESKIHEIDVVRLIVLAHSAALNYKQMSRFLIVSISALLGLPSLAFGQGIRMSPDFLPLDVGNRWEYQIQDSEGRVLDTFDMEISDYTIIEGTSYYVFSGFPFVGAAGTVGVRYDRDQRQYLRFDGEFEGDLFPSSRGSVQVVATDANDLPLRARFDFGDVVLFLERSVGIVEAEFRVQSGTQSVKLVAALVGNEAVVGDLDVRAPEPRILTADPTENVGEVSGASLRIALQVVDEGDEHRFRVEVQNISNQLLAFDFDSSQNFDFVVSDPVQGSEIWRWSERMFFSEVLRSEALQAGAQWNFEAVWNHRDRDLNEVAPGTYEVVAILVAESPVESEPVQIEVR